MPEVRYAWSGDVAIAYQTLGDGPIDLVFVPFLENLYSTWQYPPFVRFYQRLSAFSRLILLDKRGSGLSDRPRGVPTLEMQMDDVRAVLDEVRSRRAALFGAFQGAHMCALFAATYPERVRALALYCPHISMERLPTHHAQALDDIRHGWGTREYADAMTDRYHPDADAAYRDWFVNEQRLAASPGAAVAFFRMLYESAIGDVLPAIRVPTLVLYRAALREAALEVADRIASATAIVLSGPEQSVFSDLRVADEVERFVTEGREESVPDRVLATVLFVDLVNSGSHVAELGDRAWRDLLQRHEREVRRELGRFNGVEMDTAGDGVFASFDGPARAILRTVDCRLSERARPRASRWHSYRRMRAAWEQARRDRCAHGRARGRTCCARRGPHVVDGSRSRCRLRHPLRGPWQARTQGRAGRVAPLCGHRPLRLTTASPRARDRRPRTPPRRSSDPPSEEHAQ
jgi:pimeloyl-ACP methyl ester carboxylesterase